MSKKDDKKDIARPHVLFKNYDYTSDGPNETSPGGGFYHGEMGKHKSVKDFINKRRKENKKVKNAIDNRLIEFFLMDLYDE